MIAPLDIRFGSLEVEQLSLGVVWNESGIKLEVRTGLYGHPGLNRLRNPGHSVALQH